MEREFVHKSARRPLLFMFYFDSLNLLLYFLQSSITMGYRTQLFLAAFCLSAVLLGFAFSKDIQKRSKEEEVQGENY